MPSLGSKAGSNCKEPTGGGGGGRAGVPVFGRKGGRTEPVGGVVMGGVAASGSTSMSLSPRARELFVSNSKAGIKKRSCKF